MQMSATDWSWNRKLGMGESVVRAWSIPASAHSGRTADSAYDTSRLLPTLAANHRRQVLPLRRGSHGLLLNIYLYCSDSILIQQGAAQICDVAFVLVRNVGRQ